MQEKLGYIDVRDRGICPNSKKPIYYFTLDGIPNGLSVIAHMVKMDESEFKKMMRQFGAKRYGYWLVFKEKECIENAICWLKMIMR